MCQSRRLVLPNDNHSLIPWMCFRSVRMDTVKIFFSDIETYCVVVKGNSMSQNKYLNQILCQSLKRKQNN